MKKLFIIFIIFTIILTGCNKSNKQKNTPAEGADSNVGAQSSKLDNSSEAKPSVKTNEAVEIKEKMFISQINEIYLNKTEYLGKTIKLEGIFDEQFIEKTAKTYYYVYRYGPGCCGDDGNAGFEVIWDNKYPKKDDWVEAVGILESYEEDGNPYIRLRLNQLNVLKERGKEFVNQ